MRAPSTRHGFSISGICNLFCSYRALSTFSGQDWPSKPPASGSFLCTFRREIYGESREPQLDSPSSSKAFTNTLAWRSIESTGGYKIVIVISWTPCSISVQFRHVGEGAGAAWQRGSGPSTPRGGGTFGSGSTLTTFTGVADGTEVNGLTINGILFNYSL